MLGYARAEDTKNLPPTQLSVLASEVCLWSNNIISQRLKRKNSLLLTVLATKMVRLLSRICGILSERNHHPDETERNDLDTTQFMPSWVTFLIAAIFILLFFGFMMLEGIYVSLRKRQIDGEQVNPFEGLDMICCLCSFFFFVLGSIQIYPKTTLLVWTITILLFSFWCFWSLVWDQPIGTLTSEKRITATTVYRDFSESVTLALLMFVIQTLFTAMFLYDLIENQLPNFVQRGNYAYFCAAVPLQLVYCVGSQMMSMKKHNVRFNYWETILKSASRDGPTIHDEEKSITTCYSWCEVYTRMFMDSAVNIVGVTLLLLFLPIQLASSENPTEFVLRSMVFLFVVDLDGLRIEKEFVLPPEQHSQTVKQRDESAPESSDESHSNRNDETVHVERTAPTPSANDRKKKCPLITLPRIFEGLTTEQTTNATEVATNANGDASG